MTLDNEAIILLIWLSNLQAFHVHILTVSNLTLHLVQENTQIQQNQAQSVWKHSGLTCTKEKNQNSGKWRVLLP